MNETATRSEIETPGPVTVLGGVLFVWALVHSVQARTIEDYVRYSLYIAAPFAVVLLAVAIFEWRKSRFRRLTGDELFTVIFAPVGLLLLGAAYYSVGAAIHDAYLLLQSPTLPRDKAVLTAMVGTLVFGIGLFYFRLRLRSFYGLTEAIVGVAVAAQRASSEAEVTNDSTFYLAILTAGVYLVVRGIDNVHQGLTKEPFDPAATRILHWMNAMSVEVEGNATTNIS